MSAIAHVMLECFAPGVPRTKGSWRAFGGKLVPDNKHEKSWATVVGWAARTQRAVRIHRPAAVRVLLVFHMPKPAKPSNDYPVGDVDKLTRSVLDALTGIAYDDDAQVAYVVAEKRYASAGKGPGVRITVESIE